MSFNYRIDTEHRLGIVAFAGSVTGRDMMAAMNTLFHDERWQPGFSAIWDLRAIRELVVTPEEADGIARLSGMLRERVGRGQAAAVVRREIDREMVLLLLHTRKSDPGRALKIVVTLEEAAAWLGLGDDFPTATLNIAAS